MWRWSEDVTNCTLQAHTRGTRPTCIGLDAYIYATTIDW